MAGEEHCPTCGSKVGSAALGRLPWCERCKHFNSSDSVYCGLCAAPLEQPSILREFAEDADPAEEWPSLSSELAEARNFLHEGQLGDAYEVLSILHRRFPEHPALREFKRTPSADVDPQVNGLVDQILGGSAQLASKMPRRAAPVWEAPRAKSVDPALTTAHELVPSNPAPAPPTRSAAEERPQARSAAGVLGTASPRERTVAVSSLQPPAPWRGGTQGAEEVVVAAPAVERKRVRRSPGAKRTKKPPAGSSKKSDATTKKTATMPPKKTGAAPSKKSAATPPKKTTKTSKKRKVEAATATSATPERRRRLHGNAFGSHVLTRLGGKG